jgi:hypothetical protein
MLLSVVQLITLVIGEDKLQLYVSILSCFNTYEVVKQLFDQFCPSTFEMLIRPSPRVKTSFTFFQFFSESWLKTLFF